MITGVLLLRTGPVKKFQLRTFKTMTTPPKSDLDLWCLFLSRNGIQKFQLSMQHEGYFVDYTLPFCLISCPTLKNLELDHLELYFPVNARQDIFLGLTSLIFTNVGFNANANGILLTIPNLEELMFDICYDIQYFVIRAPKLKSLTLTHGSAFTEWKWFELHVPVIKTLHFSAYTFWCEGVDEVSVQEVKLPIAENLQVIELDELCFFFPECLPLVIQLLQKCPKLCQLEIETQSWLRDNHPGVLENPETWFSDQHMCNLKTLKMKTFSGSRRQMFIIKVMLSKSPALEEVVIMKSKEYYLLNASAALKITKQIIRFPRASPNAQIIFLDTK